MIPTIPDTSCTVQLVEASIEPSVGSVGDLYDSAMAETINGPVKAELNWHLGLLRRIDVVETETPVWGGPVQEPPAA